MNQKQYKASTYKAELGEMFATAENIRRDTNMPAEASIRSVFEAKYESENKKVEHLYNDLGIEMHKDTIENILTLPDDGVKWIVPEIIRDAIRLGLRKSPIYPNIIASEEPISALTVQMPHVNMMDAAPRWVNEGETIKTGALSYGTKSLKVRKMGRGIKLTDEFNQYTTLKVVSMFLQDFGVKLGYALDGLAVDILLNGEQADGSESAAVIGVTTVGDLVYKDLLRIWVRLSRMGKTANTMIAGEDMAMDILDLDEYKLKVQGSPDKKLNLKTPVPNEANLFIHGSIPEDQVVILDPKTTMLKYNARPLLVESERIVSNQTAATYATITTGFGIMWRDSRLVLDKSLDFSTNGFPAYMNVDLLTESELK